MRTRSTRVLMRPLGDARFEAFSIARALEALDEAEDRREPADLAGDAAEQLVHVGRFGDLVRCGLARAGGDSRSLDDGEHRLSEHDLVARHCLRRLAVLAVEQVT